MGNTLISMVSFPGCWRESGNKTRICIHRYIPHSQASIQFSDLVIENRLGARDEATISTLVVKLKGTPKSLHP